MRTNNYLGKHDENRGIVIFCVILLIIAVAVGGFVLSKKLNTEEDIASKADGVANLIEKKVADVDTFKIKSDRLLLKGSLKGGISNNIITKLKSIDVILRNADGDAFVCKTNYYISQEKVEFSTIPEGKTRSRIIPEDIEKGEYIILLRIKYEVQNNEEGYNYKYYTLVNNTEEDRLEKEDSFNAYFDSSKKVSSFLVFEKLTDKVVQEKEDTTKKK